MIAPEPLLCIVGPTASGKTATAIDIALRHEAEIVSCDSVQVYVGMDIGSAKPSAEQRAQVRHHLLDVVAPDDPLDAVRYATLADVAIEDVRRRGGRVVVCGGTGLWLRALLHGLLPAPPPDPEIRRALARRVEDEGIEALHAELSRVDPRSGEHLAPRDRQRVLRALELHQQTGERLSDLKKAHDAAAARHRAVIVFLDPEREVLHERIDRRVEAMLAAGLLAEVERLVARYGASVRPLRSVGYAQVVRHLAGELSLPDAEVSIKRETRRYAKRQRTWFRAIRDARLAPPASPVTIADEIWQGSPR